MGFFDDLMGGSYGDAATKQRQYLGDLTSQIGGQVQQATDRGLGAIQGGVATGRSDIQAATPQAQYALTGAVSPAIAALGGGSQAAIDAYERMRGTTATPFGGANTAAQQAQADALGLNGPEGVARAQQQFQAGPGFQFALGTGLDAITRAANRTGMAASGNTLRAAQTFGQGLGQQEWQKYLDNLRQQQQLYAPLLASSEGTAAGGIANAALTGGTGAANIYTGTGGKLADLLSGSGKSLADLASSGGLASASLISGLTGQQIGAQTKLGEDYASTYGAEAAAKQAGAAQLASLGVQGLTGLAGGGFLPSIGPGGLSAGLQFGKPYGSAAPKTIFQL